jgi:hypothetical protein
MPSRGHRLFYGAPDRYDKEATPASAPKPWTPEQTTIVCSTLGSVNATFVDLENSIAASPSTLDGHSVAVEASFVEVYAAGALVRPDKDGEPEPSRRLVRQVGPKSLFAVEMISCSAGQNSSAARRVATAE